MNITDSQLANIPDELKTRPQWVVWREEKRGGKLTKVPYSPSGYKAKANTPATWSSWKAALAAYQDGHNYTGIGYVFTDADSLTGIDLDKCGDGAQFEPWALDIVEKMASYTEKSPSGRGLHIIIKGKLPPDGRRKGKVEMYDQLRYFTMTGDVLPSTPSTIEKRQAALEALHARIFTPDGDTDTTGPQARQAARVTTLDDAELLRRAMAAANGGKFAQLWMGDYSGYPSQSEADLALCQILAFWTGGAETQIDRLFHQSSLYRKKWDTRHYGDGRTYGQGTIEKALRNTTEFYTPGDKVVTDNEMITPDPGDNVSPRKKRKLVPEPNIEGDNLPIATVMGALKKSETGDAEMLTHMYRDRLVFDHSEKEWYVWNGNHWQLDKIGHVSNLVAYKIAGQYLHAAGELQKTGNADTAAAMTKRAGSLRRRNRISNTLARAQSQPILALTGDEWDSNPWRLGVANGVVDLRDGEFSEGKPRNYIRKASPTEWQGLDTPSPRWEQFLSEIFSDDTNTIAFVQRLLGYGLTGLAIEHVLPVLWGDGRNGKGTLIEAIGAVLGNDLATPTESNTLMTAGRGGGGGPQPFLYALRGTRIVWASETNEGQVMNLGLVKQMTGGDTITCRTLHSKPVTFSPSYLILLMTNNKPHVSAEDPAIWDRLRLIPFTERFVDDPRRENEHPKDKYLSKKLNQEASGILAWLVRGCLEWQRIGGLNAPKTVTEATEDYRREEDILGRFLTECTIVKKGAETRAKDLYLAYDAWCEESNITPRSNTTFGKKIKRFHLTDDRDNQGVYYKDIGLLRVRGDKFV